MAEVEIETERVDDIPLLIHQQQRMGIPEVLDNVICPHGNRQGMSVGWLATGWMSYILSEADHRMSEVEPWATERMETLHALFPGLSREKDFIDDWLADVLTLVEHVVRRQLQAVGGRWAACTLAILNDRRGVPPHKDC